MSKKILFYIWVIVSIIAGGISILVTINIPADSKNAVMFGLSTSRLAILALQLFLVIGVIFTFFFEKPILRFITTHFNSNKSNKIVTSLGIISFFLSFMDGWCNILSVKCRTLTKVVSQKYP